MNEPRTSGWPTTLADAILKHPWVVVALCTLVVLALTSGAVRLSVNNDFRAFFGPDNPELAALENFEESYERQQNLLFVVIADNQSGVFTPVGLQLVHELTELGWQLPYSRRVTSLTNYQHTTARGDDIHVAPLFDVNVFDQLAGTAQAALLAQHIRAIALTESELLNRIVSTGGQATIINVGLLLPEGRPEANVEVVDFAEQALVDIRARHPNIGIEVGGTTATDVALGEAVRRDVESLVGLSYLVIIIGLTLLLRHVGGVIATLLVVTPSIAVTMGLFGWMGTTLEPTAGFVPSIVMTIAVADSVHILSTFYYEVRRGKARHEAVREALRVNASPVALTSITTALGVLALNFSDSPPYQELGNMVAVGVVAAWALSMTLLPALMVLMPLRHHSSGAWLDSAMERFPEWLISHRRIVLGLMTVFIATLALQIPRNSIGEKWHEYFDDTFAVQRAIESSAKYLGGLHLLQYDLRSPQEGGINSPEYLAEVEDFAHWLLSQPEVSNVDRITELIARLNMNMHADQAEFRRLPDSKELAAQLLLLYELSLPLGQSLENTINHDRSGTRMTVSLNRTTSAHLLDFDRRAQAWLHSNTEHIKPAAGTGIDLIFANINHRNIHSLLYGMMLALLGISLLLVLALGSLKLGLLSLVTNLAPAGLAYGTWALISGVIDLSASVVICMSIGIVVDDTVHFLSKYRRARAERHYNAADALRYAFSTVGIALSITTCVLVAGFAVLTASHFAPTVTTGALMAITLTFALVVDFLFLPPLLLYADKYSPEKATDKKATDRQKATDTDDKAKPGT